MKLFNDTSDGASDRELAELDSMGTSTLFENEYFKISSSQTAGLGAFAKRDLQCGDVILQERPLLTSDVFHLLEAFDRLDESAKATALSLHANEFLQPGIPKVLAIWRTNCFAVTASEEGLFPIASRFNHACHPSQSIHYVFDKDLSCLTLSVKMNHISAGEELTITYGINRSSDALFRDYGFRCKCPKCTEQSEERVEEW